jgi:hypothetical protein
LLILAQSALAVSGGQVDTFQAGAVAGWADGHGAGTSVTASGGPAGASDKYLEIAGTDSFFVVQNTAQWTGNFTSIAAIAMDLNNHSGSGKSMRLALRAFHGSAGTPGYVSSNAVNLPDNSGWVHAVFNLDSPSLTAINSPSSLSSFLTSVGEMRILSAVSPSLLGDSVSGPVGVDNITAVAAPEPSALGLLAVAAVGAMRRKR